MWRGMFVVKSEWAWQATIASNLDPTMTQRGPLTTLCVPCSSSQIYRAASLHSKTFCLKTTQVRAKQANGHGECEYLHETMARELSFCSPLTAEQVLNRRIRFIIHRNKHVAQHCSPIRQCCIKKCFLQCNALETLMFRLSPGRRSSWCPF